jgi:Sulfotransferase family
MSAMSAWHAVTDSDAFRWFAKRGPGRPVFRSRAFRRIDLARNYARSSYAVRRGASRFASVRTFCFFVGHNKSGTSLLGGLLDAHQRIVLADEADALRYVEAGFGHDQIFYLLDRASAAEARKGRVTARRLQPYSYWVPGQWQGRAVSPIVCGDSTSGTSTRRLGTNPGLLDRLGEVVPQVDVRLIQVIRNPFDPISVMMVRGGRSFSDAIDRYFTACETLTALRRRLSPDALLPVRYEDIVADPEGGLASVCRFLGVDTDGGYLAACASIVRRRPDRSRDMVRWTRPWIDTVERRSAAVDFLEGYSYAG